MAGSPALCPCSSEPGSERGLGERRQFPRRPGDLPSRPALQVSSVLTTGLAASPGIDAAAGELGDESPKSTALLALLQDDVAAIRPEEPGTGHPDEPEYSTLLIEQHEVGARMGSGPPVLQDRKVDHPQGVGNVIGHGVLLLAGDPAGWGGRRGNGLGISRNAGGGHTGPPAAPGREVQGFLQGMFSLGAGADSSLQTREFLVHPGLAPSEQASTPGVFG